jgi:hypothetical protein
MTAVFYTKLPLLALLPRIAALSVTETAKTTKGVGIIGAV